MATTPTSQRRPTPMENNDYHLSGGFELLGDFTLCPQSDLQQYFGEWLIEESSFFQHLTVLQTMNLTAHFQQAAETKQPRAQEGRKRFNVVRGNIALIEMEGPMTKRRQSLGPTGTAEIRRQMRLANADPDISGIFLKIDSPGGTMAGTADLADDVHAIAQNKPVMTFFEDMGASAAFFVGSQATKVRANESAVIGSIGTMLVVVDLSEMAEKEGIKVHVVKTGDFKAIGVPGAKITEPQLQHLQERVNQGNDIFLRAVERGRVDMSMAQVRAVADGKVHLAAQAAELGLIDGVATLDAALDELVSLSSSRKAVSMSETTAAPQAATISELRVAFPQASDSFLLSQIEKGATLDDAMKAFVVVQQAALDAAEAKAAEAQAAQQAAEAKAAEAEKKVAMPGNQLAEETAEEGQESWSDDPVKFWHDRAQELMANGTPRDEAYVRVDASYPGLREAMLAARKPQPGLETAQEGVYSGIL